MKTLTLAGQLYRAHSPSLFEQVGYPVWIGFDGRSWRIHVKGAWGAMQFDSCSDAAALIATAFQQAERGAL